MSIILYPWNIKNITHGYYNRSILNCLGVYAVGDTEFLKAMGQRIMVRRKSLRMTQEELAEKLGVSMQMISMGVSLE